jgi:hypothetical protein
MNHYDLKQMVNSGTFPTFNLSRILLCYNIYLQSKKRSKVGVLRWRSRLGVGLSRFGPRPRCDHNLNTLTTGFEG